MVFLMLIKMFLAAAPYVVAGFLMAGAMHQWVPQELLKRHLGRSGGFPLLKAVGIGSLLPMCSCGTIPLGVGLYRCGAAVGTILTFMTSSPVLSPVVVLIAFKLLGVKLALILIGTALLGSFLIGWIGNLILPEREKTKETDIQYEAQPTKKSAHPVLEWLRWSFLDLGAHVSVELVLGLGLASLVMAFLPMEFIAGWLGPGNVLSLVLVLVLCLPVYTCSVPSVPVVQSLLLLGLSPGAALVYMMAGPATNMGELNAIRATMGMKTAVYYAAALVVVALAGGLVTDHLLFADYNYMATEVNGELIVQQCCVPVLYNQTSIYGIDFSSVSPLEWGMGAILLCTMLVGLKHEIGEFISNPCKTCIWREYQHKHKCAAKCHVRRKHEWFRRILGLKRSRSQG